MGASAQLCGRLSVAVDTQTWDIDGLRYGPEPARTGRVHEIAAAKKPSKSMAYPARRVRERQSLSIQCHLMYGSALQSCRPRACFGVLSGTPGEVAAQPEDRLLLVGKPRNIGGVTGCDDCRGAGIVKRDVRDAARDGFETHPPAKKKGSREDPFTSSREPQGLSNKSGQRLMPPFSIMVRASTVSSAKIK